MADLAFVNRASDWARTATITATTEASGYPATNAGTDDLQAPWKATSGTATLTVTLSGSKNVDYVALIGTNADDGKTITVGGLTGVTLTGDRDASGRPVDLVYVLSATQATSAVTFAISGNSANWSVARVVVGTSSSLPNFLDGFQMEYVRPQYTDENDFGHEIRYDLGVTYWKGSGDLILTSAQMATLSAWYESTLNGLYPTTFFPRDGNWTYPSVFGRFDGFSLPRTHLGGKYVKVTLAFRGQAAAEVT